MSGEPISKAILMGTKSDGGLTPVLVDNSGNLTPATLTGDVEIGAVEIKNGADDTRAKVGAGSGLVAGDNALAVADPTLIAKLVAGTTIGATQDATSWWTCSTTRKPNDAISSIRGQRAEFRRGAGTVVALRWHQRDKLCGGVSAEGRGESRIQYARPERQRPSRLARRVANVGCRQRLGL